MLLSLGFVAIIVASASRMEDGPVTSQDPARATDDVEDKVLAEQCRVFFHHPRTALIGNLVAAIAMVALFWDNESNSGAIIAWSASVGVFSIVRWLIYRRFDASVADPSTARGWARAFLALTAASGVIWGALSLIAFDPADQASSFYVVFAVICMAGAGLGALAAYGPALVSFLLLAIVPLIVSGFLSGVETYVVVAATLTFLLFVLVRFGLSWERTLRDQIRDRLEKELLLDQARERTNMAELLELTLANIDQGVIVRDADDNIVLFNDRLAELLDVPREMYERNASSEELNAYHDRMGDFDFVDEGLAETLRKWQQRRAAGIPIERLSYERKDRMGRWLHAVRQPMPNGMEVRTFLDITERKSAEESALEKARLLETTLESMGQGLTMYDADWNLVSYNSRYLEHFDMPADMFAGENTFDDVVGATMRQDYGEDWQSRLKVVRDPTRMTDVWRRSFARPTGRWLDLLSVPVPTGGFVVTSTDMTEQKKAESELRRQQTINETVLDAMDQGLLMIDGDGRYLLYNKKLCDLIDLPEELLATYPTHAEVTAFQWERGDFDHLSEKDRARLQTEVSRLESTRDPFVYERVGPSGRVLEIRNNPLPDGGWVRIWTDVTARKEAEREVAEKQRQLELTLENMEQGIILLDEHDRTILFNEKASTLLGVPREMLDGGATSEEFVDYQRARGEFDKVDPSLWQEMAAIIKEQKNGVIHPFEYERERPDGSWLHVLNKPVESGGWLRTYRDVTEAKRAAERIRRARDEAEATERKLRDIVAALPIGVAVFDEALGMNLWNQAYCDLAGLPHELVEGNRTFQDNTRLIYENSSASRRVPFERFAEEREERFRSGRRFVGEFSFLRPYVDVQYSLSPLGDGGVLYASVDITSQKQAQREAIRARDEARTAQANLQGIIDRLPVGVLVFDEELQIVLWNHVFLDYVAIAEEEMRDLVTFDGLWRFLYTNFPHYHDIPFERFMREKRDEYLGEGTVLIERQHVHPPRDTQQIVAPLPNGGRVVAATDISVQKRAEREALEAKEAAEEATRAKSAFLAAMSHEIRTPMNGVLGMIEVLEQSSLDADQRSITQTVRDSAISLLTIIDDILDFSKIEAGELRIDEVPLSVRDLAESALDIIGGVANAKGLDVALSADPAVVETISADPVRLRQILLNLLGNAVKFTETGSILLEVEALETEGPRTKRSAAEAGRQRLRFAVTDTGIGIPEERLPGLFEAFRQAEASTTRRFGGTGLGLSICKRLVDLMDGEIGVESDPGVGSSFWFTLSLAVPLDTAASLASRKDLAGVTVLLVDDSPVTSWTMEAALKRHGAEVVQVPGIDHATAMLTERAASGRRFDVLVRNGALPTADLDSLRHAFSLGGGADPERSILVDPSIDRPDAMSRSVSRPVREAALVRAVATVVGRVVDPVPDLEIAETAGVAPTAPTSEEAIATGRLILVAEDNVTNRIVVQRQLSILGYAAEVAEDGARALELWRHTPFSLVLTDCHMPIMDGFELTAAIREEEAGKTRRTPIVALTANALVGEAERCLNAGMDDYLAKPVRLSHLGETLGRWIDRNRDAGDPPPSRVDSGGTGSADQTEQVAPPIDPAVSWSTLEEMIGGPDPELVALLVATFKQTFPDLSARMTAALAARDHVELRSAAHAAAGASASLAALRLAPALRDLETKAREAAWDGPIEEAWRTVEREATAVLAFLDREAAG